MAEEARRIDRAVVEGDDEGLREVYMVTTARPVPAESGHGDDASAGDDR